MLVFSAVYLMFYDPNSMLNIYMHANSSPDNNVFTIASYFDTALLAMTYIMIFSPFLLIITYRNRLFSRYKMRQLYGVLLFVTLTNIIYILIMNLSTMRMLLFKTSAKDLITVRVFGEANRAFFLYVPYLIYIAIFLMIIITGRFHLIRQGGMIHQFYISRSLKREHQTVSGILHSIKNIILSYKVILDDIQNITDETKKTEALQGLSSDMQTYIKNLSLMLTSNNIRGDFSAERCYLSDIVDEALSEFRHDNKVTITRNYLPRNEVVFADSYYLKSAIFNIIDNANDAIMQKGNDGNITIDIISEFDLAILTIRDTGVGIKKQDLKNIFRQYYTTKSHITNCGIGLSFAYKIIKKHKGHISVQSKYGQGTTFNIIFHKA